MRLKTAMWLIGASALALALAACATTPDSRISRHQAEFDAWPAAVQQKIRAGEVAPGFTAEMVRVALGEPARSYTLTTVQGTSEVWLYRDKQQRISFGLGLASGGGGTAYGGGVGMSTGGGRGRYRLRVVFTGGRVTAVESGRH